MPLEMTEIKVYNAVVSVGEQGVKVFTATSREKLDTQLFKWVSSRWSRYYTDPMPVSHELAIDSFFSPKTETIIYDESGLEMPDFQTLIGNGFLALNDVGKQIGDILSDGSAHGFSDWHDISVQIDQAAQPMAELLGRKYLPIIELEEEGENDE